MATTQNQDALKAARNHFKKHKKNYIIGLCAWLGLVLLAIFTGAFAGTGSNTEEAEPCMVDRITSCEKYEKDQKESCETYLENSDKDGFNKEGRSGKTCSDLGFEWVDKEAEEKARIEAEKQQCESEGKRWWNEYVGCLTQEEAIQKQAEVDAASEALKAKEAALTDAKRKCTVMEASDIHQTGIGGSRSTAFEDARAFCESSYSNVYKYDSDLFISEVTTDWNNRKNERINGNDLTYHLNNLGW